LTKFPKIIWVTNFQKYFTTKINNIIIQELVEEARKGDKASYQNLISLQIEVKKKNLVSNFKYLM